jgi:hypothetical protein
MPAFDLETFAENGVLRESTVRKAFASLDWERFRNKTVHVRGCGQIPIPTWAYLMAAAYLSQVAKRITFGEDRNPMPIFTRDQAQEQIQP